MLMGKAFMAVGARIEKHIQEKGDKKISPEILAAREALTGDSD